MKVQIEARAEVRRTIRRGRALPGMVLFLVLLLGVSLSPISSG